MKNIIHLFVSWITNPKTIVVLLLILLLWLIVGYGNYALYKNCGGTATSAIRFISETCIEEGERNTRVIHRIFYFFLTIGLITTFVISLFSAIQKNIK